MESGFRDRNNFNAMAAEASSRIRVSMESGIRDRNNQRDIVRRANAIASQ